VRVTLSTGTPAELARPDTDIEPRLGVVLFPDVMGLRPLFDDMCARLAAEHGWVMCAPEPFPGREELSVSERLAAMSGLDEARLRADALAAADATGCERVVATGFCMGGMLAFKAAASGRFARAAAFYGMVRLPHEWEGGSLAQPVEALASPDRCPTFAVVGLADSYTPAPDVAEAEALGVEVVRYEGAEHGFVHDASRPTHRADDAADAWRRVIAFLTA
jgi:carboxymethylenebutenolidase